MALRSDMYRFSPYLLRVGHPTEGSHCLASLPVSYFTFDYNMLTFCNQRNKDQFHGKILLPRSLNDSLSVNEQRCVLYFS